MSVERLRMFVPNLSTISWRDNFVNERRRNLLRHRTSMPNRKLPVRNYCHTASVDYPYIDNSEPLADKLASAAIRKGVSFISSYELGLDADDSYADNSYTDLADHIVLLKGS